MSGEVCKRERIHSRCAFKGGNKSNGKLLKLIVFCGILLWGILGGLPLAKTTVGGSKESTSGVVCVQASEIISMDDFELRESEQVLREGGYQELNYEEIVTWIMEGKLDKVAKVLCQKVYDRTIGDVVFMEKTLMNLLLVVILSAFFTNFANVFSGDCVSNTGFYVCYLVVITMMLTLFENFCRITSEFLHLLLEFIGGVIPTYFLSVAVVGQVSAAGFYELVLVIIAVVQFIFLKVTLPLIKIYVAISLMNHVSQEDFLSRSAKMIGNFIAFVNKSMLGIVTGIHMIQGLVLPSVDGAKNTTIRKVVGSLPVVGDGADAMTGIVLGSANLIKNSIGTFAIVMVVVICMVPFVKLQLYSASMQVLTAVVQPVADKRIIGSLECMHQGIRMLSRVVMSAALLFIISIAIICMMTNMKS